MTARTARVLYDTTKIITVVSGIVGGILTFIAAGISDNYTLVGQSVPGNYDLKIMHIVINTLRLKKQTKDVWQF